MTNEQNNDPLDFMRNIWGNMGFSLPGMVAPTFDLGELDKRIKDMKAVEGWLRMNLSMLQMTIQSLEMQRSTVSTVQAMGQMASDAAKSMAGDSQANPTSEDSSETPADENPGSAFSGAALWPWQIMQQVREHMQQHADAQATEAASTAEAPPPPPPKKSTARRGRKT